MQAINNFEQLLQEHSNVHILKFYLHISPEEQQSRLKERVEDPRKQWKCNQQDFEEAKLWNEYMSAYNDCFNNCNHQNGSLHLPTKTGTRNLLLLLSCTNCSVV